MLLFLSAFQSKSLSLPPPLHSLLHLCLLFLNFPSGSLNPLSTLPMGFLIFTIKFLTFLKVLFCCPVCSFLFPPATVYPSPSAVTLRVAPGGLADAFSCSPSSLSPTSFPLCMCLTPSLILEVRGYAASEGASLLAVTLTLDGVL
uniref:Uncharacterized protein n=1 Tax=Myotis myotis TaxID=51298 RepID=A0A7J7SSG6_MYOMY|nr:hypothetical protein mMyoMyo1_009397 [Myotis myotis]